MLQVPLAAVASQTLSIVLDGQAAQIAVYVKSTGLYFDLLKDGVPIVNTRIVRNQTRILLDAQYLGFTGDFCFVDTQGTSDPSYDGLGSRYQLIYLEASDLV
jgi:hypothetical protein